MANNPSANTRGFAAIESLVDVAEIVSRKAKPRIVYYTKPKGVRTGGSITQPLKFYEFLIWMYANTELTTVELASLVRCEKSQTIATVVRRFNVAPEKRVPSYQTKSCNPYRNPRFEEKCKKLFDSGTTAYEDIAKKMKCGASAVVGVAKRNGWYENRKATSIEWIVPMRLPICSISEYRRYSHTVRHYTRKIYERFADIIDPNGLRGKKWHVDHMLSVHDAYHLGDKPLPWQLIVHPANMELLSFKENREKGCRSSINPKQLVSRIRKFESEHGSVALPIPRSRQKRTESILVSRLGKSNVSKEQ